MQDQDINILIVDDTPEHIQAAGLILKEFNCPIRIASSGAHAIRLIRRQVPTLVLLDISLGDMSGFDVCRSIKQIPECRDTAVIFVTAAQDEESIQKGFLLGAQDYVIKPFRPSELKARVRTHIRLAVQAKELKASIQELDQFCHTVSHDLKSPIMVIRQLAAALVDSVPEESREQVQIPARLLDQKCSQTIAMIERLLEFSRMTKLDFHLEAVSPEALFVQVFQELRSLEPERSVRFHCDPMPIIQADPTLFRLLAQNLLGNALKFTRRKTDAEISVTCEKVRGGLAITIADNGAGFDMAYADRLFHVFERLHSPSDFEGSGVGLAITARIMKTHGGSVSIVGEPDKGCRVTLWFPLP